jgi:hypothetical protein
MWIKQSTVFTDRIGPVIDSSGVEYGGLTISDLSRTKNGTTTTMSTSTLTYDANGYYSITTIAGDSDTLGRLVITCNKSTYQMPPRCYMVIPATVYDVLVTNAWNATNGGGDVQRIAGNTQTAGDLYAYLTTNLGSLGANLTSLPKTGYSLAANGLASVTAWTVTITGNLAGNVTGSVNSVETTVAANLTQILGTALTETAGYLAAGFKKFFNVDTPTSTMNQITLVDTSTNQTNAPASGDFTATMKTSLGTAVGTAQTGDSYAIVSNGTYGNSAIKSAMGTAQTGDCYAIVNSGTFGNSAIKAALGTAQTGDAYAIVSSGTYGNSAIKTALGAPMQASSYSAPPSAATIASTTATAILVTPANKLLTNSIGEVTSTTSAGGTGSYTVTITVNDGTTVLQNATVTLTINSSRYYATTNASGVAVLTPNEGNGTYGVQLTCGGYQFTPTTKIVSGNTSQTYSMTAVSITPSTGSGVTMYGYTTDSSGNVVEGSVTVQYQMSKLPTGDTGVIVNPTILTVTSNGSGLAQFVNCRVGATYRVRTSRNGNVSQWGSFVAVAGGGQIGSSIV